MTVEEFIKARNGSTDHRWAVDVTTVGPGQIEKMARSGAVPSEKFQAAIDRARKRRVGSNSDDGGSNP